MAGPRVTNGPTGEPAYPVSGEKFETVPKLKGTRGEEGGEGQGRHGAVVGSVQDEFGVLHELHFEN